MSKLTRKIGAVLGLKRKKQDRYWQKSYAQEGEDLVLLRLIDDAARRQGFFVDVGAHHPSRFSNTRLFYDLGWRGVSIDPRPGFANEFLAERPEDTAIESAIGPTAGDLTYYMFDEPALNGFDANLANDRDVNTQYNIVERRKIAVQRLEDILAKVVDDGQPIDFLSIDVEGFDFEVIQSNDWQRYRPRFVLVEIYGQFFDEIMQSESAKYLIEQGYKPCSRTCFTVFFEDARRVVQKAVA